MRFVLQGTGDLKILLYSLLRIPFRVADRLADIYLLAMLVDAAGRRAEKRLLLLVLLFAGYRLLSEAVSRFIDSQLETRGFRMKARFLRRYAEKYMRVSYTSIESTEGKDRARRAQNAMSGTDYRVKSSMESFYLQGSELISDVCGIFVYAGIIALLNPLILLLLLVTSAVSFVLQKTLVHYDQKDKVRYIPLERRLWYLIREMRDPSGAKDLRLYGMQPWLKALFSKSLRERMKLHAKRSRLQYAFVVLTAIVNAAFTGYIYYYLIVKFRADAISIAQFLLYFGLITGFQTWLISIIDGVEEMHRILLNIEDLRAFQEMEEPLPPSSGAEGTKEEAICLDHVSFSYQEGRPVLEDLSFCVHPGEKIAVVGLNGAGKTTMVKLLTGLYQPQKGHVFIHGKEVSAYPEEERYSLFAAVFQDLHLLPASIERNITLSSRTDEVRFRDVVEKAGLKEKIALLPAQEKTLLVKSVRENAIALSGGEEQKLALARALYKGGEILILDEPTAKLDPIAEDAMYQKYHTMTEGKTTIFISHRLSSTRFCDRILLLENGRIQESGTHEELMQLGGSYAKMFAMQSRYYQEEAFHEQA